MCCAKERGEHGTAAGRMCGQDGGFAVCWRRFVFCFCWVGGMENGTMALGIGTVRVMGTGTAGVLLTWAAGGFQYAARP